MKKALALILAGVLAVGMSTVALAADYGSSTNKPSDSVTSSNSPNGTSSNMPASTVTGDFVEEKVSNNGTVYITKDATISSDAINAIKESGKTVTFKCVEEGYSFTIIISGNQIKESNDLSLGASIAVGNGVVEFTPKMKGEFGTSFTISLSMDEISEMENPRLFYIDDDGNVWDYGPVKTEGNTATFAISHASSYVIADGTIAGAEKANNPATLTTSSATVNPDTGAMDVTPLVVALLAVSAAGLAVSKKVK